MDLRRMDLEGALFEGDNASCQKIADDVKTRFRCLSTSRWRVYNSPFPNGVIRFHTSDACAPAPASAGIEFYTQTGAIRRQRNAAGRGRRRNHRGHASEKLNPLSPHAQKPPATVHRFLRRRQRSPNDGPTKRSRRATCGLWTSPAAGSNSPMPARLKHPVALGFKSRRRPHPRLLLKIFCRSPGVLIISGVPGYRGRWVLALR